MKFRKFLVFALVAVLAIGALSGCNKNESDNDDTMVIDTNGEVEQDEVIQEEVTEQPEVEEPEVVTKVQMDLPSLFKAYEDYFSIGVAIPMAAFSDDNMKALIKLHFNSITSENSMKPESMMNAGNKGEPNFITANIYNGFAEENGLGLRGHTLIWHQQTPAWFFTENFGDTSPLTTREEMLVRMENHIKGVLEHFEGSSIYAWDVVNEVIDTSEPDNMRNSAWLRTVGPDFAEKAFEYARKYTEGTDVKLFYNDYNIVADKTKRMAIYELVKGLKEKGLIDGVGLQSHINISGPSAQEFEDTIELFGSLGLEVQITELDISLYTADDVFYSNPPEELLIQQAYLYKEIFDVFKKHSDVVTNVTFWGLTDDVSWLNSFPVNRKNWPLLFDKDYQAKLAYYALVDPDSLPPSVTYTPEVAIPEGQKETVAIKGTPVIDGTIDPVWDHAHEIMVDTFTQNTMGATAVVKSLWDSEYLYVLAAVTDSNLQAVNGNPWEQDSIEIFIDENMNRTTAYEADDVQYRVSFNNEVTLNGGPSESKYQSATTITETGYIVEIAIPFNIGEKAAGVQIGFDVQINDDQGGGVRESMTNWNDLSGQGWNSTLNYGTLILE